MIIVQPTVAPPDQGAPPMSPGPPFGALQMVLTGVDGSTWNLTDLGGQVVAGPGIAGLGPAQPEHWWEVAPALDGSSWTGMRVPHREFFLPITVSSDVSGLDWRDVDAAFWRAIDPRGEVTIRVTCPDATTRTLRMRYSGGADPVLDQDPLWRRHGAYGLTFVASWPFWQGELIQHVYPYASPGAAGMFPGPPFTLVPSRATNDARVNNPGDLDAWPTWRITGPFSSFTVGVGDSVVAMTRTVAAGGWVDIDMDPRTGNITDDQGVELWDVLTAYEFAAIPPGPEIALRTELGGAATGSSVELAFTPNYWRAL